MADSELLKKGFILCRIVKICQDILSNYTTYWAGEEGGFRVNDLDDLKYCDSKAARAYKLLIETYNDFSKRESYLKNNVEECNDILIKIIINSRKMINKEDRKNLEKKLTGDDLVVYRTILAKNKSEKFEKIDK